VLAAVRSGDTGVLVNTAEVYPGEFTRQPDYSLPTARIIRAIKQATGDSARFIDASGIATALLGNSIAANMFMLGYAYQLGLVPLSAAALTRAIELNGEAVAMNLAAFAWGRKAASDLGAVEAAIAPLRNEPAHPVAETLDDMIARRVRFLENYQNAAYAQRYLSVVNRVQTAEQVKTPGLTGLAEAAARYLFKLMAYKDEYEVARLYTDGTFAAQLAKTFEGDIKLEFHLAPPILSRKDPTTGLPRKMTFGPWMMHAFRLLAMLRGLRGTAFDIFGYSTERRVERRLVGDYERLIAEILGALKSDNHAIAVALASIPEKIRGYGHVKQRHLQSAKAEEAELLGQFRAGKPTLKAAAE
jgi:indolepyruvate ferredoxin oxidoreductase